MALALPSTASPGRTSQSCTVSRTGERFKRNLLLYISRNTSVQLGKRGEAILEQRGCQSRGARGARGAPVPLGQDGLALSPPLSPFPHVLSEQRAGLGSCGSPSSTREDAALPGCGQCAGLPGGRPRTGPAAPGPAPGMAGKGASSPCPRLRLRCRRFGCPGAPLSLPAPPPRHFPAAAGAIALRSPLPAGEVSRPRHRAQPSRARDERRAGNGHKASPGRAGGSGPPPPYGPGPGSGPARARQAPPPPARGPARPGPPAPPHLRWARLRAGAGGGRSVHGPGGTGGAAQGKHQRE